MFAFRNQFHGYCQPPNVEIEIEPQRNISTHLSLVTKGNKRSSLDLNLLALSVKQLNHKVEKIRFPQI